MSESSRPLLNPWSQLAYRLRQFTSGLRAQVSAEERATVARWLPPAAWTLFAQMPLDAQRHSLNVLQTLRPADQEQPDLAAAALLHDVGKLAAAQAGIRLNLWWRGPLVLLEALLPQLLLQWSSSDPTRGWRYLLYVHHAHPQIGAAWAKAAGCTPLTCWLIEHHQAKSVTATAEQKELLAALQWADHQN